MVMEIAVEAEESAAAPVLHVLRSLAESSRADHMMRALRSEFGNPAVLDGFVDNPLLGGAGQTMAVGPTGARPRTVGT